MRYAELGHNVYVGGYENCPIRTIGDSLSVHIWNEYHLGRAMCPHVVNHEPDGTDHLVINYADGRPLTESSVSLDRFAEFVRDPARPLFLHCGAGLTRSPTYALMAKCVRGCDYWTAITDIVAGIRAQYSEPSNVPILFGEPLRDIWEWISRRPKPVG